MIFNIREETSLISFSSVDHIKIFSSPKVKKTHMCTQLLGSVAVATIVKVDSQKSDQHLYYFIGLTRS